MPSLMVLPCGLSVASWCMRWGKSLGVYSHLLFFVQLFYSQKPCFTHIISSSNHSFFHSLNQFLASVFGGIYTIYTRPITKTTNLN